MRSVLIFIAIVLITGCKNELEVPEILPPEGQSKQASLTLSSISHPSKDVRTALDLNTRQVAVASAYYINLWNLDSKQIETRISTEVKEKPERLAFSSSAARLRLYTTKKKLTIWNLEDPFELPHTYECAYAVSNNIRYAVIAYGDSLGIIDLEVSQFEEITFPSGQMSACFSPNERFFVYQNHADLSFQAYDLETDELIFTGQLPSKARYLSISNTGHELAYSIESGIYHDLAILKLDSVATEPKFIDLTDKEQAPKGLTFSNNGQFLFFNTYEYLPKIYDSHTSQLVYQAAQDSRGYNHMVIDSSYMIYVTKQGIIRINQEITSEIDTIGENIGSLSGLSKNQAVVCGFNGTEMVTLDLINDTMDTVFTNVLQELSSFRQIGGRYLSLSSSSNWFDLDSFRVVNSRDLLTLNTGLPTNIAYYTPDLQYYRKEDGFYFVKTNARVIRFIDPEVKRYNRHVAYSEDGKTIGSYSGESGQLVFYDLPSGRVLFKKSVSRYSDLQLSPDGRFFIFSGRAQGFMLTSLKGVVTQPKWISHYGIYASPRCIDISPSGEYIALQVETSRSLYDLTVWSLRDGELKYRIEAKSTFEYDLDPHHLSFIPGTEDVLVHISDVGLMRVNIPSGTTIWSQEPPGKLSHFYVHENGNAFFYLKNEDRLFMVDVSSGEEIWELGMFEKNYHDWYIKSCEYPIVFPSSMERLTHFYPMEQNRLYDQGSLTDSIYDKSQYLRRLTNTYLSLNQEAAE